VRDVLNDIMKWWDAGETFGLATVVRTFRSAPREPGAALAVSADGRTVASASNDGTVRLWRAAPENVLGPEH